MLIITLVITFKNVTLVLCLSCSYYVYNNDNTKKYSYHHKVTVRHRSNNPHFDINDSFTYWPVITDDLQHEIDFCPVVLS